MTIYAFNRVINENVGCPLSKFILCLLAHCPQFTINSLARESELSLQKIDDALEYLVANKFIIFRNGTYEGKDGTEYQIELLF